MTKMNFVYYCADDMLNGTMTLSVEEELAYRRIVDLIYSTGNKLERPFYLTLFILILFVLIAKFLDFFLAIGTLSFLISFFWGERRIYYLFIVSIIFPIIVFIFFETILGLRFPPGIITNIYYQV